MDLLLLGFLQSPVALIVLLVIALLVFGKRLPEVARSLGKGIVEFKKGVKGIEEEVDRPLPPPSQPTYSQGQYTQPQYGQQPYAQQPYNPGQQYPGQQYPGQQYPGQYPGAQQGVPAGSGPAAPGYTPPGAEQGNSAQPQGTPSAPPAGEHHKPLD